MSPNRDIADEMQELLAALREDEITDAQAERLTGLLREDRSARRMYIHYTALTANIRSRINSASPIPNAGLDVHVAPLSISTPSAIPPLSTTHYPQPTSFVGGPVFSYMVATVVLCLMLLGAWGYKISHVQPSTPEIVDSNIPPSPTFVGRITGTKDCRWSDPDTQTVVGASVALDRRYALASGLLEITYKSGARVILEGPCTYKVESFVGGFLERGKLTANIKGQRSEVRGQRSDNSSFIPHSSYFVVKTPTAIVTDLGTEFGVEVSENGDTISHVFQGSVLMAATSDGVGESRGDAPDGIILRENEAAQVKRDQRGKKPTLTKLTVGKASQFVTIIPPTSITTNNAYAKLVLSFHPVVYYRMERPKDEKKFDTVVDSSGGGYHSTLHLGDQQGYPYRFGHCGDALWCRGPLIGDYAIVPDYPKANEDGLTVSAWVTAEKWMRRWPKIASNWGNSLHGQFNMGLYKEEDDLVARVAQRDGTVITIREGRSFPFSEWQHVAFVADGAMLRLYRNGEEVASAECNGLLLNPPMRNLVIGGKTYDNGTEMIPLYCWRGLIDEFAIFNSALPPEAIRDLYEMKTADTSTPPRDNAANHAEMEGGGRHKTSNNE